MPLSCSWGSAHGYNVSLDADDRLSLQRRGGERKDGQYGTPEVDAVYDHHARLAAVLARHQLVARNHDGVHLSSACHEHERKSDQDDDIGRAEKQHDPPDGVETQSRVQRDLSSVSVGKWAGENDSDYEPDGRPCQEKLAK